jgi:hypothetical protein
VLTASRQKLDVYTLRRKPGRGHKDRRPVDQPLIYFAMCYYVYNNHCPTNECMVLYIQSKRLEMWCATMDDLSGWKCGALLWMIYQHYHISYLNKCSRLTQLDGLLGTHSVSNSNSNGRCWVFLSANEQNSTKDSSICQKWALWDIRDGRQSLAKTRYRYIAKKVPKYYKRHCLSLLYIDRSTRWSANLQ